MAKKGNRLRFTMKCAECRQEGYISTRNRVNTTEALVLDKFCNHCRKVTSHKEVKQ